MNAQVIIVGGGAAGLFCASLLGQAGINVILLEKNREMGKKLRLTGGGHANFTNRDMSVEKFLCQPAKNFCYRALEAFKPKNIVEVINSLELRWEERAHGKIFLKEDSSELVRRLVEKCNHHGARLFANEEVKCICPGQQEIRTTKAVYRGEDIVLAQGSCAWTGLGKENDTMKLASALGHDIIKFQPALTPLYYDRAKTIQGRFANLAGISIEVEAAWLDGPERIWRDDLLFTHRGISGPAAFNASLYWKAGKALKINFLPGVDFEAHVDCWPKRTPLGLLKRYLPNRLALALLPEDLRERKNGQLSRYDRERLGRTVNSHVLENLHGGSFRVAEVCLGGVSVNEIVPLSMESRLKPNVYIIGEMMAVTGELGGYNLHWAWASAYAAACSIIGKIKGKAPLRGPE